MFIFLPLSSVENAGDAPLQSITQNEKKMKRKEIYEQIMMFSK